MTIQDFINKGFPDHVVADGIFYTWLYMAGPKSERGPKQEWFTTRFQLYDMDVYGGNLLQLLQTNRNSTLVWGAETLLEFLPRNLQEEYLDEYIKYCTFTGTVWANEARVLQVIASLFDVSDESLKKKIKKFGEKPLKQIISKQEPAGSLLNSEEIKASVIRLRSKFKLDRQDAVEEKEIEPTKAPSKSQNESRPVTSTQKKKPASSKSKKNIPKRVSEKSIQQKPISSEKKIFFAVGILMLFAVLSIIYTLKISNLKEEAQAEAAQLNNLFEENYHNKISDLETNRPAIANLYKSEFDQNHAIVTETASFLFTQFEYEYYDPDYVDCLERKLMSSEYQNRNRQIYSEFRERFGNSLDAFLETLAEEGFNLTSDTFTECVYFFDDIEFNVFKEHYWDDIEKIMTVNSRENGRAAAQNLIAEQEFERDLQNARNQLRWQYRNTFESSVNQKKSSILREMEEETETFTDYLGSWVTTTTYIEYDKSEFERILNSALISQWESNSLSTGSMPYSNCFGSSNSCSGFSCSEVEVTAGGRDVLVTIKNRSGHVVRHGYINSGHKYSFNLPNGSYQVYFYSGIGWNPNKVQNSSTCSNLRGGFVSGESFSKDREWNYLNNHILTYQLRQMTSGNFHPSGSNASEAF